MPTTPVARANQGGTINFRGRTINYGPSEGQDRDPMRGGSGGTMTRNGAVTRVPPSAARISQPFRTPSPASQEFLRTGVAPEITLPPRPQAVSPVTRAPMPMAPTPAYRPPQQTERANPLTGDNNFPMEGQTVPVARAPFIQRGTSLPAGRDAMPAAEIEDGDIGRTMQGIQSRIAGSPANPFARRFGEPSKQSAYNAMLKRVMG